MGVDGCPGGWFCVELGVGNTWRIALEPGPSTLITRTNDKRLALIDIPIGLLEGTDPHRECDRQARKLLGRPRAASVFPTPTRQAVYAKSYEHALAINHERVGRGLSKQTWNITPKIKQLDEVFRSTPRLRERIRESHPEVCFWSLNGKQAMQYNKKQVQGFLERLALLTRYFSRTSGVVDAALEQYPRKYLARDDILDALVLAVSARFGVKRLTTIPVDPPVDRYGIAMEMVYAETELIFDE